MRLTPGALVLLLLTAPLAVRAQESEAEPVFPNAALPPEAVAEVALGLNYDLAVAAVQEWGSEQRSIETRARLIFSSGLVGPSVRYGVAQARHTTTAYRRCACTGLLRRTGHAVLSEFVEHRMDGSATAPVARFSGYFSSVLATAPYQPGGPGAARSIDRVAGKIEGDLSSNLIEEFWPDIRRMVVRPLLQFRRAAFSSHFQPRP